jgi:hypothetical protein
MALLVALDPSDKLKIGVAVTSFVLSHFINYPHFAHSYQIFYRNFRRKLIGAEYGTVLRLRYFVAGILAPSALILFFITSIVQGDAKMLGLGGNLMIFLVGWHYVKQGYGMIIVDSVLKRKFFSQGEKKVLLINAYTCWILYWVLANWLVSESQLQGLKYYSFAMPVAAVYGAGAIAGVSTALVLYILFRKGLREKTKTPINGIVAYLVTIYAWLLVGRFDPILLLLVPVFHSLQYLIVVWRYQLNYETSRPDGAEVPKTPIFALPVLSKAVSRFCLFIAFGVALGYMGFWGAPILATAHITYDHQIFGGAMYFFIFWIFINVHHYFLDNVMWRRENPETGKYLFMHS